MTVRERLLPLLAGVAVLAVAAVVLLTLSAASSDGVRALEEAKAAQVETTARSFDARVEASLGSIAGLGARPWELVEGSAADQAVLDTFAVDPDARSGSFLVDGNDVVTAGVLLEPGALGTRFSPPGWADVKQQLATDLLAVLPVRQDGLTTDLPHYGFAIGIPGAAPGGLRGALVFEAALTEDSTFQQEISALRDSDEPSAVWRFIDSNGVVVATSADSGLGRPATDLDVEDLEPGLTRGERLVFSQDVPSVGWRVVFVQDREEFVAPLTGPLRTAGLVMSVLLLLVGLVLVGVLSRRLRRAREEERRLRELTRAQEEFISVVSHELRTPVAGVLGFLQTTLDHWELMSEAERATAVRRAFLNARRLQAMTRDVLDTESLEAGRFGYTMVGVDLTEEVRTAVEGFAGAPQDRVELDVPGEPIPVHADPDRLQQVLANLLDNARKNAPTDTAIRVRVRARGSTATVEVEDEGGAIATDQVDRIFDKFVRGRDGEVAGTGLGLYISRRIVEEHRGRIWAETVPGEHTRFVVELPVRPG